VDTSDITKSTDLTDTSATPSGAPSTTQVLAEVAKMTNNNPVANAYYPVYSDQPRGSAGYCAWHSAGTIGGIPVEFGFFFNLDGDPGCNPGTVTGQSQGLTALANVSGHELSEMLTDPQLNAWYDRQGYENADKCAWTFDGTVTIGGQQWKIQGNWSNAAANTGSGYDGSGCIQTSGTVTQTPDFGISASPSSQTVTAGGSTTYTVSTTSLDNDTAPVTLGVTGLPSGASPSFETNPVSPGSPSVLTVTTDSSTKAGTYSLTVSGSDGTHAHTANVTLVVQALQQADFSLSSCGSLSVSRGGSDTCSVNITWSGGSGSVNLSVSGLPRWVSGSFSPNPATGSSSTLTISANKHAHTGTSSLTVTGVSGSLSRSATFTLYVS
jgi:hypothetical protein